MKQEVFNKSLKWLGIGLIGGAVGLSSFIGCSSKGLDYDFKTDLSIKVLSGGYVVSKECIDRSVLEAQDCVNNQGGSIRTDYDNLLINVVFDGFNSRGEEYFKCKSSKTGLCAGEYGGGVISVTPNLKALKHEVIHWEGYSEDNRMMRCQ